MDSVEETLSLAAKTRNILTLFTPGQRAQDLRRKILLFLQEKDELISSFCAMLSYCLSLYYIILYPSYRRLLAKRYPATTGREV